MHSVNAIFWWHENVWVLETGPEPCSWHLSVECPGRLGNVSQLTVARQSWRASVFDPCSYLPHPVGKTQEKTERKTLTVDRWIKALWQYSVQWIDGYSKGIQIKLYFWNDSPWVTLGSWFYLDCRICPVCWLWHCYCVSPLLWLGEWDIK